MPRPGRGALFTCIEECVCEDLTFKTSVVRLTAEWLSDFSDEGRNPHARWGTAGVNTRCKWFECRAHVDCPRCLKVEPSSSGNGVMVSVHGTHGEQVRPDTRDHACTARQRDPRGDVHIVCMAYSAYRCGIFDIPMICMCKLVLHRLARQDSRLAILSRTRQGDPPSSQAREYDRANASLSYAQKEESRAQFEDYDTKPKKLLHVMQGRMYKQGSSVKPEGGIEGQHIL